MEPVPDDPHPRAVTMARALLFALGLACVVIDGALLAGGVTPAWELALLAALGAGFLLSAGFGPPAWAVAIVVALLY